MGTQEKAPAGRPRSFDEEEVLGELTALFWRQGYGQTSMADIVAASGLHKPSLYRAFGSKEELFAIVLRRYLRERMATFAALIEQAGPGVQGVHRFLDLVGIDAESERGRDGCLMVMASNELRGNLSDYDFSADYREQMSEVIGSLVVDTVEDGPGDDVVRQLRTDLLTTHLLGLHVIMRSGAGADQIRRYLAAMHHVVDTW